MVKLTLSADKEVVRAAKRMARREKTSVSAMFSRFIRLRASMRKEPVDVPPDSAVARLTGFITLPKGKTFDDVLYEALSEKYGIRK